MAKYYRFGHMARNHVRAGDVVKKGDLIGTVGNGNSTTSWNRMTAHLHMDISRYPITTGYIRYWTKKKVQEHYIDPNVDCGEEGYRFNDVTEYHHMGYDWLSWNGYGYHPGVDLNGEGAGNADMGNEIYSPIDGVVTYEWRGWSANGGWGNLIVIRKQEAKCNHKCPKHC